MANKILKLNATNNNDVIKFNAVNLTETLNASANLLNGVDLDTIKDSGVYCVYGGSTALNFPEGADGLLIVPKLSNTGIKQIFIRAGSTQNNSRSIYHRHFLTTVWSNWIKLSDCLIKGDTIDQTSWIEVAGIIGANRTTIYFSIPLNKEIQNDVNGVSFSKLTISVYSINGRLIQNIDVVSNSTYSVSSYVRKNGYLSISVNGFTDLPAGTPISVEVSSFTATFS